MAEDGERVPQVVGALVEALRETPGVAAVALGGSRARGTHTAQSDVDLGVYSWPDTPLDLAALRAVAARFDDHARGDAVTAPGEWGLWVNGGAWLTVRSTPVDLIYRDLARVSAIIEECLAGQVRVEYQAGHPFGFVTAIYLGEVALCAPLWDPQGALAALKARVTPYPPQLKAALLARFGEAGFTLKTGAKGVTRLDVAYVAGSLFRCVMVMTQTLFALNEQYWMNEKGAVALADGFPLAPARFAARVAEAFALLQPEPASLTAALDSVTALVDEVEALLHA